MMADKRPQRRRFQFGLRTLLLSVVVASVIFAAFARIQRNRQQREAVCAIWGMGALTVDGPGEPFIGPLSGLDWALLEHKTWLDDLVGAPCPIAVLFPVYDESIGERRVSDEDVDELAEIVGKIPTVETVCLKGTHVTPEGVKKLQEALPDCEIKY
jgi:predicted cation transporter